MQTNLCILDGRLIIMFHVWWELTGRRIHSTYRIPLDITEWISPVSLCPSGFVGLDLITSICVCLGTPCSCVCFIAILSVIHSVHSFDLLCHVQVCLMSATHYINILFSHNSSYKEHVYFCHVFFSFRRVLQYLVFYIMSHWFIYRYIDNLANSVDVGNLCKVWKLSSF